MAEEAMIVKERHADWSTDRTRAFTAYSRLAFL